MFGLFVQPGGAGREWGSAAGEVDGKDGHSRRVAPIRFRSGGGDTESGGSGSGFGFGLRIGSGSNQGLGRVLRADPREFQVFVLGLRVSNSFSNFDRLLAPYVGQEVPDATAASAARKDAICARSGSLATWLSSNREQCISPSPTLLGFRSWQRLLPITVVSPPSPAPAAAPAPCSASPRTRWRGCCRRRCRRRPASTPSVPSAPASAGRCRYPCCR